MRMMLRFEKGGAVQYISHLDLLRVMQRALVRSGLPLVWSQGYHPHPVFTFAMALPVGARSRGEYMEAALADMEPAAAARALNAVLGPGLTVTHAGVLPQTAPSLMAAVRAADWLLTPPPGANPDAGQRLLARERAVTTKHGKNGPREVDIRPGILSLEPWEDGLLARLAAGSQLNVAPSLLIQALWPEQDGLTVPVCRLETYYRDGEGFEPLLSLATGVQRP